MAGILHTLPFLIPAYRAALAAALATIVFELVALAWIRWRFFATGFLRSFISIAIGGAIIASVSAALGAVSQLPSTSPEHVSSQQQNHQQTRETALTPAGGHDIPAVINSPAAGRARPVTRLKAGEATALTRRRPPHSESAGPRTRQH